MRFFICLFVLLNIFPIAAHAGIKVDKSEKHETTWKNFDSAATDTAKEIKWVVFGILVKILGVGAISYGVCMLFFGQTRQMITSVGIGLLLNIIPYFVDSVYGAMLPR